MNLLNTLAHFYQVAIYRKNNQLIQDALNEFFELEQSVIHRVFVRSIMHMEAESVFNLINLYIYENQKRS